MSFIRGAVTEMKRKFDDPYIVVSGDFNQWPTDEALEDFPDVSEVDVGPTRGKPVKIGHRGRNPPTAGGR